MKDRQPDPPIKTGMAIQLLGAFSVSFNQVTIPEEQWRSRRARSLVKLLALAPGHRLHRNQVMDTLWPDSDLPAATNNFHHTLFAARRVLDTVLPGWLPLEEGFLGLTGPLIVDVEAFEASARRARESQDLTAYQVAVDLYTGDLLPDDRYEEWTIQTREALRQTYMIVLLSLANLQENRQDYPNGITTLLRLLAADPSHEEAHRGLMRLYALSGQRQQALRQYQTLRGVLQTELDVEPSPATLELYESIQSGRVSRPAEALAPIIPQKGDSSPQPARKLRHNLPNRLSTFIGREKEIDRVIELLRGARLLTITGAGGVGKTSLALQVVGYLLDAFADGVWLVELAPLADPELVVQACAQTLEVSKQPETPYLTALVDYLRKKHLLLILDNCEHLIGACGHLATELLKACPKLTILTTSRELFNLPGEIAFRVPSLTTPEADRAISVDQMAAYESVRLFVERARQTSPGYTLNEDNQLSISLICQRLDGIPLAIELAASRTHLLSTREIAARLDQSFNLLTGGSREALPRQQTLKATIDWSYDLLPSKERLLLQRLSVFAGGWALEAAESVASEKPVPGNSTNSSVERIEPAEILDLMCSLVDKSLVIAVVGERGARYRMLEIIRQYASDRLREAGGSERAHNRHLAYFAVLTSQAEPRLRGKGQIEWLDQLDDNLDNLRAAMEWSQNRQMDLGLQIVADLTWFWWSRNLYSEGRDWSKKLLLKEENDRESQNLPSTNRIFQRARTLRACYILHGFNPFITRDERMALIQESVTLLRKLGWLARRELATSLFYLLPWVGGRDQDSPEKQEMLEIFRQENMLFYTSELLQDLALIKFGQVELVQAAAFFEESLVLSREIGDLFGTAERVQNLGETIRYLGEYQRAESLAMEGIQLYRRIKSRWGEAECYLTLITIELAQGRFDSAAEHAQLLQTIYLDFTEKARSFNILYTLLYVAWSRKDYIKADRLGHQMLDLFKEVGNTDFSSRGSGHYLLGRIALSQKELERAGPYIKMSIQELSWKHDIPRFLLGAAVLFNLQRKRHQAVCLSGTVDESYQRIRQGLSLLEQNENREAMSAARSALGEEVFAAAWQEGLAMTMDQAKAYALDNLA